MPILRTRVAKHLLDTASALLERVQQLEEQHAILRARIDGEADFRIFIAQITNAAQAAPIVGEGLERFAQAMRAPLPRGRSGGLARARTAWRYFDGTFMPDSEKFEFYREEYQRYATGGRARAASALRGPNGRFVSMNGDDVSERS